MAPSAKFLAVVLDLDGTLLDTLSDIANSANEVLAAYDVVPHQTEAYRRFIGDGVAMLFTRALPEALRTPETITACAARFSEVYDRRWNDQSRPYKGVPELLETLAKQGVKLTVLSNKPHVFTLKYVAEFFPHQNFDMVLGQREGVPRKPDPAGAHEIVMKLQIPVAQILYLGDSGVDMRTAVAAGMYPVGAAWGFRSRAELESCGAKRIIEKPLDFLEFFTT